MIRVDRALWRTTLWACCLILALVGCSPVSTPPAPTLVPTPGQETNQLIETDSFEGVIFAGASAKETDLEAMVGFAESIDDYWTPSRDDVLAFETGLGPYLGEAAPQTGFGALKDLSEYRRQYVGMVVDGQRVIYAIFFCSSDYADWQQEIVLVIDGGSCYFEVKYDVQTGEFYDLSIHGEG